MVVELRRFLTECRRGRTKPAGTLLLLYKDTHSVLLQYILWSYRDKPIG